MTALISNEKPSTVLDSWCSISEKTVFVLDRSRYFTHVSSGHLIKGDFTWDPKNSAFAAQPPINPFDRSLWTCAVEAVVSYSRLIWDLFSPQERCISILAAVPSVGEKPTSLPSEPQLIERICSWSDKEQNLDHLLKALAKKSHCYQSNSLDKTNDISKYPNAGQQSPSIVRALDEALSSLGRLTQFQINQKTAHRSSTTQCDNNGRIILITSFQNEQSLREIITEFEILLKHKNESLRVAEEQASSSSSIQVGPINYCDLVIVNTFPIDDTGACSQIDQIAEFRPQLHVRSYSVKSGKFISGLLNNLCLQHHNLKSTTITGIPMKEEQNASSSAQYDVEIIHCSSIHEHVLKLESALLNGAMAKIDRFGFPCDTFRLHWCTPRTPNPDMHHCVATSRITLVDVYSRPSACLTNFLLNGKQVLLEIYKSKSNRTTTHVLASHNGELFIHSLATSQHKSGLGDPPSITENLGGKVGDYRVHDFVSLMKKHMLVKSTSCSDPLAKTMSIIRRQTLYWPISIGHTILMNIPNLLGELVNRIIKESMSRADVDECKKSIDNLMKCEKEGIGLPSITMTDALKASGSSKSANPKLDQLYKLLWNELEYFLRVHSTTPEHESVLEHLLLRHAVQNQGHERGAKRALTSKAPAVEASPMKKQKIRCKLIPDITDPGSAEAFQKTSMFFRNGLTLYQTWSSLYNMYHQSKSKLPFVGRQSQQPISQQGAVQQMPMDT